MSLGATRRDYIRALYEVQEGRCFHCDKRMSCYAYRRHHNPLGWTQEHVKARCAGGHDVTANIVLAHVTCNSTRGSQALGPMALERAKDIILRAHNVARRPVSKQVVQMTIGLAR